MRPRKEPRLAVLPGTVGLMTSFELTKASFGKQGSGLPKISVGCDQGWWIERSWPRLGLVAVERDAGGGFS